MKQPGWQNGLIFFLLFISAFLFYLPTSGAGFVTDQIGWIGQYEQYGWSGIPYAFHDNALHYFYHLAGFLLWKAFGFNGLGWLVGFITLHTVAAYFSYRVFTKLFTWSGIKSANAIALAGSFLFLLSPYQTEPLCWYACIHYPLCISGVLISFHFFLNYLETGEKKNIVLFYLFFVIALFALELSFSFPLIIAVFVFYYPLEGFKENKKLKLYSLFLFPLLGALVLYFGLSKLIVGNVTGHYGADVHLNFSVPLIIGNFLKYTAKIFTFAQYIPFQKREALFLFFEKTKVSYSVLALLVVIAGLAVFYAKKINAAWKMTALLLAFYILGLSVILNLFCSYVIPIEGDRFMYFGTVFAGQLAALVLIHFLKKFGWVLVAIYLGIGCWFLYKNVESWKLNREIHDTLESNFKWYDADRIYILNLPDNLRGTYMYRDFQPGNSLAEALQLRTGKDIRDKTYIISNFNMETMSDSVKVTRLSADSVKVEFAQYGNWWWTNGVGAAPYSNELYDFSLGEWGVNTIHFKQPLGPNDVILYQCGKEWRVLK